MKPTESHPPAISDHLTAPPARVDVAAGCALFLDVDGTLLDIAEDPDGVVVAASLVDLLARLQDALQGALALLSGRNLDTLDRFFAPHAFPGAGLHGLQLRHADGRTSATTGDREAMAALRAGMQTIANDHGLIVEDKGGSLALHFRRAPELGRTALDHARRLAAELGSDFVVQRGDHVVEIRPDGADKGQALLNLMAAPPFAGRAPIAIGDDHTDEHAFAAATALGGIGIIVGPRRPTRAHYALADPSAVHQWLRDLLAEAERGA